MSPLDDNDAFWRDDDCFVAAGPRLAREAERVREFAGQSAAARSLVFFQTSGSEGNPKWCGLSRAAMLASAGAVNAHLEASAHDRWLIALPLHHVGGFSILARCFAGGASFARMDGKWDPAEFAGACAEEGITLTSLVPTQVFDLVQAKLHAPASLRAVIVGGAGLGKETGRRAQELGWRVLQSYGMTESASQIATEPLDRLYQGFDPDRLEVLPIWNLSADDQGRLIVRGQALASGYAVKRDDVWLWEPIDAEAGLSARDRAEMWLHGTRRFLRFLGRDAAFVKINGELVNLAAVQARIDAVCADRGLAERMVVVDVPDSRSGSRLVLAGECDAKTLEEVAAHHHTTCAPHERFIATESVDLIPVTELGKPALHGLRALVAARVSRG